MKPPLIFLAALLTLAVSHSFAAESPSPSARQLRVLELRGSPYERGLQHGRELREDIARILALWKADIRSYYGHEPDEFVARFLATTNFQPAIERWTPDLLDEVRGIADGSGQPFETIYAFQLMDELWVFGDRPENAKPEPSPEHCSSLGVARSGGHPALVAQTMDLETFRDGFQIVLHLMDTETEPEQYVLTSAGLLGVNGLNNRSVAIACNTLMELSASTDGLPVVFVVRGVLAQSSGEAAVKFLHAIRHASGQNYIVGIGDRVLDFETSAEKVVPFLPSTDGSVVYHTNHPLANDDWKPWHRARWDALPPTDIEKDNSVVRLHALRTRLSRPAAEIDHKVIRATLCSKDSAEHAVCRALGAPEDGFTFAATIMTLSDEPSFAVTMGPPDTNPFVRLEFTANRQP